MDRDNLGLADRTEIEFFNGGHTINGKGTFNSAILPGEFTIKVGKLRAGGYRA